MAEMKSAAVQFVPLVRIAAFVGAGCFALAHLLQATSVLDLCYRAAVTGVLLALGFLMGYATGAGE